MTDATVEKIARELARWEAGSPTTSPAYEAEARRILALLEPDICEQKRAAWMNHGEWMYHTLATTGRLPSRDEAEAEAARRYPKEEKA
ncbi:MAG: hypothetical protein LLG08_00580 [Actinomycetia bacterium]|nr:hypothetical protein [Actinomycetes bacterium]